MRSRDWIGWSAALAGVLVVTSSAIAKPRKHVLRPYQVVWRATPAQSYEAYAWAPASAALGLVASIRLARNPGSSRNGS
jgi:hypothetical protein